MDYTITVIVIIANTYISVYYTPGTDKSVLHVSTHLIVLTKLK